ncbi:MFS transporter [Pseudomonas sp. MYb118]|uniref:MFS transporter n=1 Tax=Pseudomonas sp. MYb118 TaxID=1848720 RepID=UPI0034CEBCB0
MTTTNTAITSEERLPLGALLAMAMTGFLALLTETMPAGMLVQISQDLDVSEALAGQFVTLYAIGSLVAAIPLTAATLGWRRRPLLVATLLALLAFNTLTALTSSYYVALAARLLAGMAAGLIWGMLAGYARRMVADPLKGRALAVAGLGAPLALSLGVPLGTLLGSTMGWRSAFTLISLLTVIVIAWVLTQVPDYPGQAAQKRASLRRVLATPGVLAVMAVLVLWVLAHNILFTYVMPYLALADLSARVDVVLLVFGVASLLGLWITGLYIDRQLRRLVLLSLASFALAAVVLGLAGNQPVVVYFAVAVWGLTFGGSPALLQTASANAAGSGADVAQSILVTSWNIALAGGGILGGVLLETAGVGAFPWAMLGLLLLGLTISWRHLGKHH